MVLICGDYPPEQNALSIINVCWPQGLFFCDIQKSNGENSITFFLATHAMLTSMSGLQQYVITAPLYSNALGDKTWFSSTK